MNRRCGLGKALASTQSYFCPCVLGKLWARGLTVVLEAPQPSPGTRQGHTDSWEAGVPCRAIAI